MPESDTLSPTMPSQIERGGVSIGQGYSTRSLNIICFIELDQLPVSIDMDVWIKEAALRQLCWSTRPSGPNCAILNSAPWSYSEQKRRKLQLAIVTWNVPLPQSIPAQKIFMNIAHKTFASFVRLHQHQNHSMKYQLFKWTPEFVTAFMFCKMNGYLQNFVLEIWLHRMLNTTEDVWLPYTIRQQLWKTNSNRIALRWLIGLR